MIKSLYINKDEVLRYLGYRNQGLEENIEKLIDGCINEVRDIIKVRFVYKFFEISMDNEKIFLENCTINFQSKSLLKHLKNSKSCVLMAVTLGSLIDTKIRYYEKLDMTKALILDACATTAIEEACDRVCEMVKKEAEPRGKTITSRFSPGYGDLGLNIQSDFISVLEADKIIGLTSTRSSILLPRKSVTAVVGLIDANNENENNGCLYCNKSSECQFKRGV